VPLADIYGRRLDVLRPSRDALAAIGTRYVETLVDGAAAVVAVLHALGKSVGIVSGGLRPAVVVVGKRLGIDPSDVHAVDVAFEADGSYRDFDRASPFARNGGKPEFFARLPAERRPVALVGDGVTDLEAATAVERFVGFGGVERRERVVAGTPFFVAVPTLLPTLDHLLTEAESAKIAADPRLRRLLL
jgi:phosphoserine phosphatase